MSKLTSPIAIGAALQIVMVVAGHYAPGAEPILFPVAGTLIGALTGWLAGPGDTPALTAGRGAIAGCAGGVAGSIVCTALGDAPVSNLALAGASTLVAGALGALARRWFKRAPAP